MQYKVALTRWMTREGEGGRARRVERGQEREVETALPRGEVRESCREGRREVREGWRGRGRGREDRQLDTWRREGRLNSSHTT